MTQSIFQLQQGNLPLLISMPHNGVSIPDDIRNTMTAAGLSVADTDWDLDRLYAFAKELGVYLIVPAYSRYVIDLNRSPDGANLYPGADSTELCPTTNFQRQPLYKKDMQPNEKEIQRRVTTFWQPYHQAVADTLAEIQKIHGKALLLEAHSICSQVPRFFAGQLPDFNFGTNQGKSCTSQLHQLLENINVSPYSKVIDGRFKGGYITRAYANLDKNIETVQLELSQRTYMDEALWGEDGNPLAESVSSLTDTNHVSQYSDEKAQAVIPQLQNMVQAFISYISKDTVPDCSSSGVPQ
ncbi:N-formylglutamate deformylase [Thalassotalea litorea]|uniref:N-formylglutamate deformylase n=1 Tax=Thalassotalea litorea TaxID=2020715 RepID=A0A5R9INQ2_9GAMM|nr:N-formylglutamate deformylase [Thalassotalea litorea]TLU65707.1 N-formylglutamate deformylase [Thalassotalea litorea]